MGRNRSIPLALFAAAGLAFAALTTTALPAPEPPGVAELLDAAQKRYARVDSYIARLTRRETLEGKRRPQELLLVKARERPWSVYAKWLGEEGRGREGVYVEGQHGGKVHVRLAAGDLPFVAAGHRMALDPNGVLLRAASPHPITELGIGPAIGMIGAALAGQKRGDPRAGKLAVVGPEFRAEFGRAARGIEHRLPPAADPVLPLGGPADLLARPGHGPADADRGRGPPGPRDGVYLYDRLELSVHLDDEDFDPDRLWGRPTP
jgi:hypothetical protein